MIIALGLYIGGWWFGLARLEQLGAPVWRKIQPFTAKLLPPRTLPAAWSLGILWGFLPCGLIYSTLSWAAARGNASESAQLMAVFGLGTLPAMAAVTLGGEQLRVHSQKPLVRKCAGVFLMVIGVLTIAVPWSHAGHSAAHALHQHASNQ